MLADVHGALFAAAVLGVDALVLLRGQPQDGAQRRSDLARVHHVVAADALAEFGPAGSLQNDLVARCDLQLAGREEIDLGPGTELHVADLDHGVFRRGGRLFGHLGDEGFVGRGQRGGLCRGLRGLLRDRLKFGFFHEKLLSV